MHCLLWTRDIYESIFDAKEVLMDRQRVVEIFEAFFEKYKKTEGERTSWSAHWTVYNPGHSFEINLTKCPQGVLFNIFCDTKKVEEVRGWGAFLDSLDRLERDYSPAFTRVEFFGQMEEML
jgi:hypothetical protein